MEKALGKDFHSPTEDSLEYLGLNVTTLRRRPLEQNYTTLNLIPWPGTEVEEEESSDSSHSDIRQSPTPKSVRKTRKTIISDHEDHEFCDETAVPFIIDKKGGKPSCHPESESRRLSSKPDSNAEDEEIEEQQSWNLKNEHARVSSHEQEDSSEDDSSDSDLDSLAERIGKKMRDLMSDDDSSFDDDNDEDESTSDNLSHTASQKSLSFVIDKRGRGEPGHSKSGVNPQQTTEDSSDSDSEEEEEDQMKLFEEERERIALQEKRKQQMRNSKKIELTCRLEPDIDPQSMIYTGKKGLPKSPSLMDAGRKGLTKSTKHLSGSDLVDKLLPENDKDKQLMKMSVLTSDYEKKSQILPYKESRRQLKKQRQKEREKTKGGGWFNIPAPEMTEELKNDLMVLKMRRSLDPKHFYKASDQKGLPKYFQMGRVVEAPVDFYHSRIPKKQRKKTLVDELLADSEFRKYNKRKYEEIQESRRHGKGAYKKMKRMKKNKR